MTVKLSNIIDTNLSSIVTSIGLDHLDWLPKNEQTIEKIVFEKTSSLLNSNIIVSKQNSVETTKRIKKSISNLVVDLTKEEYSLSVRAANTISLLDDVTQDPNMPSYVRTQLWQAVSKLESIRE